MGFTLGKKDREERTQILQRICHMIYLHSGGTKETQELLQEAFLLLKVCSARPHLAGSQQCFYHERRNQMIFEVSSIL